MFDILFARCEKGKIVGQYLVRGPFVHLVVKHEELIVYRTLISGDTGESLATMIIQGRGLLWQTRSGDMFDTWSLWNDAAKPKTKPTKRRTILVEDTHDPATVLSDRRDGDHDPKDHAPDIERRSERDRD